MPGIGCQVTAALAKPAAKLLMMEVERGGGAGPPALCTGVHRHSSSVGERRAYHGADARPTDSPSSFGDLVTAIGGRAGMPDVVDACPAKTCPLSAGACRRPGHCKGLLHAARHKAEEARDGRRHAWDGNVITARQTVAALRHLLTATTGPNTCGASTVAIDNKIEQAMDLVKSHLMYAVREEVLVLKEQIKELLEKNSQLEYENNVLRAGASPETLAKLSQANTGQTQTSSS